MSSSNNSNNKEEVYPPLIDLTPFATASTSDENTIAKEKVAKQLQDACHDVGFFQISTPSLKQDMIDKAFQSTIDFFDLSLEEKLTASAFNSPLFRGYQGLTSESHSCTPANDNNKNKPSAQTSPSRKKQKLDEDAQQQQRDLKESFTIGQLGNDSRMHGANNWPTNCPAHIRENIDQYWNTMLKVAYEISRALALSLGLKENFFIDSMTNPVAQMVLLRYPPPLNNEVGCGAHTDCGFLTLLVQDKVQDALQIKDKSGNWIDAPQKENCVLCNLGDMAERWTNNYYRSTWHRVNNRSGRQRHSIPFFCNLNYDAIVDPETSVCQGTLKHLFGDPKFEKTIAGDYICEKLGLMHDGGEIK